jgi:hypothetical protein
MRAVGAPLISHAAALGAALDGEVYSGHLIVVRNGKLGPFRRTADQDTPAIAQRNLSSGEWSRFNFEDDPQLGVLQYQPSGKTTLFEHLDWKGSNTVNKI